MTTAGQSRHLKKRSPRAPGALARERSGSGTDESTQRICMVAARKRVVGRPFQPGHDPRRNTRGRLRGAGMTALARQLMDEPVGKGSPATRRRMMLENLINIAATSKGAEA